jgi:hypothetical protein
VCERERERKWELAGKRTHQQKGFVHGGGRLINATIVESLEK